MAAATRDIQTAIDATGGTRYGRADVAASTKIFYGTVIAVNAAGYVVPASDTAALKVIGLAQETVDNSAGADGAKTVGYVTGVVAELNNSGTIVQASKHKLCYAADDNTVTTTAATNDIPVGLVCSFTATKVRVFIDERANA